MVKNKLELVKTKYEAKSNISENKIKLELLEQLIKIIGTLTVKILIPPEGWSFFFFSFERAFNAKNVSKQHKDEILLNLFGDKASYITYLHT